MSSKTVEFIRTGAGKQLRMNKDEAIDRAREWAASQGLVLNPLVYAWSSEDMSNFPSDRNGWLMLVFCGGDSLDGEQILWIHQTTKQIDWPKRFNNS
jgi:hypothetical protein